MHRRPGRIGRHGVGQQSVALFNMVFGGLLALAALAGGVLIAYLLTRVAYPN
jgi:hypothetical protein